MLLAVAPTVANRSSRISMHGAHPRASCIAQSSALMTRKRPTSKTCASMTSPLRLEAAVAIAHEPSHVVLDSIAHPIRQDRVGGSRFLRASISAEDEPTPRKTIRACGDGGPICARSHLGRLLGVFCRLHFCEYPQVGPWLDAARPDGHSPVPFPVTLSSVRAG
jgi:hypothetical protein